MLAQIQKSAYSFQRFVEIDMPSVNDMYISVSRDAAKPCKQCAKHVSKLLIAMFLSTLLVLTETFSEREKRKKISLFIHGQKDEGEMSKIQNFTIQFFEH